VNNSSPELFPTAKPNPRVPEAELVAMRSFAYRNLRWIIVGVTTVAAVLPGLIPFPPHSYFLALIRLFLLLLILTGVFLPHAGKQGSYLLIGISCLALGLISHLSPQWMPLAWGIQLGAVSLLAFFHGARLSLLMLGFSIFVGVGLDWRGFGTIPLNFDRSLTPDEINWLAGWITYGFVGTGFCIGIDKLTHYSTHQISEQTNAVHYCKTQITHLEETFSTHANELSRRITQIQTATEISRAIAGIHEEDELLRKIVALIHDRFQLYYAGVFLVDELSEFAILKAGSGEAGKIMFREGHRLAVGGSSMIGWCIAMRKPRISFDVGQEDVRFANPQLPLTRSEMALPLLVHDQALGALTIQSTEPNAFDETDVSILSGIADNLAVALFNARLFRQIESNLDEISHLHQQYLADAWMDTIEETGVLSYTYQAESPTVENEEQTQIQIPLTLRNQVIGRVVLGGERERFTPEELAFIDAVITQTALALENTRLLAKLRRQLHRERKVNEINSKLLTKPDIDEIIKTAATELGQVLHVPDVLITLNVLP